MLGAGFSFFKILYSVFLLLLLLIAIAAHKEKREKLFVATFSFMLLLTIFYTAGQTILESLIKFREAFHRLS